MTLQPEHGAPSFYTFATFKPARRALLYGGLSSILAFWAEVAVFNYGIHENLWTFETVRYGTGLPSPAENLTRSSSAAASHPQKIVRVALADHVLRSLAGAYYSASVNRKYLVALEDGRLSLQVDGQEKVELIPVSAHSLYAGEERWIEFTATSAGTIDQLDIFDHGRHIIALRQ